MTSLGDAVSMRAIAERLDTSALGGSADLSDAGLGAGAGNGSWWGGVSTVGTGAAGSDPFVVFNPAPFERHELV